MLNNIKSTRHAGVETGSCLLPAAGYSTLYPLALGDIDSLQFLKFRADLCGHIVTINCGKGPLDVVISNSNLGGGLDLYASTWNKLTNSLPPGVTQCSIQLSSNNLFNFGGYKCFHQTSEVNSYYRNVALLNTGSRIVKSAKFKGVNGAHRGGNPYYAFDGFGAGEDVVSFFFEDGGSFDVKLKDCKFSNHQTWS